MDKKDLLELKKEEGIKFIYKIPSSFYKEGFECVIIGNLVTKEDENVRYFSLDDWFLRMTAGSILPYACTTLPKYCKVKEFLSIYDKPDMLKLRKFITTITTVKDIIQEGLWGIQIVNEHRINRHDVFTTSASKENVLRTFLSITDSMYKMSIINGEK